MFDFRRWLPAFLTLAVILCASPLLAQVPTLQPPNLSTAVVPSPTPLPAGAGADFAPATNVPADSGPSITLPNQITFDLGGGGGREQTATVIKILITFTILTLAPSILIMVTSFTRIIVVLSFVRRASGINESPPTQVLIGLALFLTFFTMAPTWQTIQRDAYQPYMAGEINESEAYALTIGPIRKFMFDNTRDEEMELFLDISNTPLPNRTLNRADVPNHVLLPAFMLSEIKTAFIIGFLLFIPFLVIDMIVASILLSMGMMMLPPVIVSLPFKLILFVLVDGWSLVVRSLMQSFNY